MALLDTFGWSKHHGFYASNPCSNPFFCRGISSAHPSHGPMAMAPWHFQVLSPAPLMKPLSDCPGQQLVDTLKSYEDMLSFEHRKRNYRTNRSVRSWDLDYLHMPFNQQSWWYKESWKDLYIERAVFTLVSIVNGTWIGTMSFTWSIMSLPYWVLARVSWWARVVINTDSNDPRERQHDLS